MLERTGLALFGAKNGITDSGIVALLLHQWSDLAIGLERAVVAKLDGDDVVYWLLRLQTEQSNDEEDSVQEQPLSYFNVEVGIATKRRTVAAGHFAASGSAINSQYDLFWKSSPDALFITQSDYRVKFGTVLDRSEVVVRLSSHFFPENS
jgi:hypothetical protein